MVQCTCNVVYFDPLMYGTLEYMIRLLLTSCTTFRHTQYTCKYTYKHCTAGGGVVLLLLYISDMMIFIEFVLQVVFTLCCVPFLYTYTYVGGFENH